VSNSGGLGSGIVGQATHSSAPEVAGVRGETASSQGIGVAGWASSTAGGIGVFGRADSAGGIAVRALATSTSAGGTATGVYASTASPFGVGVWGSGPSRGVFGEANGTSPGTASGVEGRTSSPGGAGVEGVATATSGVNYGVYGQTSSTAGYAGYFQGRVHVTGTLSKGGGSFKIDHPLDPENKYLYHSFVESPDMMNIYNGNVTTDADGFAVVELPAWFGALNRDFRYQLTVIGNGTEWARARVYREVNGNRFTIQTDHPGVKVSWLVTGIRKDAFAEAQRIPVEEEKPTDERGTYLHPSEHGVEKERGLDHRREAARPEDPRRPTGLGSGLARSAEQ
jgi:hypothetical protein